MSPEGQVFTTASSLVLQSIQEVLKAHFSGIKWLYCEVHHLSQFGAEVQNAWIFIPLPLMLI